MARTIQEAGFFLMIPVSRQDWLGKKRLLLVLWLYGQCSKDLTGWENAGLLYKPLHFYIIFCWHYN